MGAVIGGIAFIGSCLILMSLMTTSPQYYLLAGGISLLLVALVIFIREIRNLR